jgi:hypothetical protein
MLRQQAEQLHQQIANLYLQFPELKDDDEMLRVDTLEGATDLKELATAILNALADARALHDGAQLRMDELKARQDRFKMRGEFLRAMLLKILQTIDVRKLELAVATVTIKAGQPRLIGDPDPNALPDELCRISREPDRAKIRDSLLRGRIVPGFTLSNGEPSLAVYVK